MLLKINFTNSMLLKINFIFNQLFFQKEPILIQDIHLEKNELIWKHGIPDFLKIKIDI